MDVFTNLNINEISAEDRHLIRKAKSRFVYWQGNEKVYRI